MVNHHTDLDHSNRLSRVVCLFFCLNLSFPAYFTDTMLSNNKPDGWPNPVSVDLLQVLQLYINPFYSVLHPINQWVCQGMT